MSHDVIELGAARYGMHSEDAAFSVTRRGFRRFLLKGEVAGKPSSTLAVTTPSAAVDLELETRTQARDVVEQLRRELPRDVMVTHTRSDEGVEVALQDLVVPAAKAPRLRIVSTDLIQRVVQLDDNKLEFIGTVGTDSHLTILCDGNRATILVRAGISAEGTAVRVGSSMPRGYRALVEGPVVTVWKEADFFEMVA